MIFFVESILQYFRRQETRYLIFFPLTKLINESWIFLFLPYPSIITSRTKPRNTKIQYETTVNKSIQSPSPLCRPIIYGKPSSLIILKTVSTRPFDEFFR